MSDFKVCWHKRDVAVCWPRGSVVLLRLKDENSKVHGYSYALSLYFTAEGFQSESFNAWEFLLVEEAKPKEKQ